MDGSQCKVKGCEGVRRIEEVCVDQHGGCGVFNLVCTRDLGYKPYFESRTYYQADDKDFRTGRYAEATLLVIGLIFAGCGFAGYEEVCAATGLLGWSWKSCYRYFWRFYYAAEDLWADSKQRLISNLESENRLHSVIGLFDGGWLHRGYASQHGSAAIVDTVSGAVNNRPGKAHDEQWNDGSCSLDELLEEAKEDGAEFQMLVADADAGVRETVTKHGITLARCTNHGGKNAGNAGIEIGKGNQTCNCPVKQKADCSGPYKSGGRSHKKITKDIAKRVQAAFGAKTSECGADVDKWLVQVPQIINHYFGEHCIIPTTDLDDRWVDIEMPTSMCEHHPLFYEDQDTEEFTAKITEASTGPKVDWAAAPRFRDLNSDPRLVAKHCPFLPLTFGLIFDCPQQKADWDEYMRKNIKKTTTTKTKNKNQQPATSSRLIFLSCLKSCFLLLICLIKEMLISTCARARR